MKLLSLNVERSKHLGRVGPFVRTQNPDVLCLQEVCERDIPFYEDMVGQKMVFAPMVRHPAEEDLEVVGIGMLARQQLKDVRVEYYTGHLTKIPPAIRLYHKNGSLHVDTDTVFNAVILADIDGITIGTTHFTWSADGQTTPAQLVAAARLLDILLPHKQAPFVLCGDMNAPRGRGTFGVFNEHFTDGIPQHYSTSLDGNLHRAGPLELMVDVMFHTPCVCLNHVSLHAGVSDHCAVTADVSLNNVNL